MKNLLVALFVFVAFSAASFAVNDNTLDATKKGTGSFNCRVLTPLTVAVTSLTNDLGVFVVAPTSPYPQGVLANNTFTWNIAGENGHSFYFYVEQDLVGSTPGVATIKINMTYSGPGDINPPSLEYYRNSNTATLSSTGTYWVTATVTELTALASGNTTFTQKITVGYNGL